MSQSLDSGRSSIYGWVIVVLAAIAMVATFPGRTFGLGFFTERILTDPTLNLDRTTYGDMNFWATLVGALFCFPAGWMLDRWGLRLTSSIVIGLLGLVIVLMTRASGIVQFAILITLTRGLGQSALSVVSISMTGKWFKNNLAIATAVYSTLVTIGFAMAFMWGKSQMSAPWREQWSQIGIALFVLVPIFALLARSHPSDRQVKDESQLELIDGDFSMGEAIATPAFWVFGLATAFYGLAASGISLFQESLLGELGYDKSTFYDLGGKTMFVGLAANLLTGWASGRIRITIIATIAMALYGGALLSLSSVKTYPQIFAYACTQAFAGGMITVLFFTVWARLYGKSHLGRIQSVAQMLTVLASAIGPSLLGRVKDGSGSYLPAILTLGLVAVAFAIMIPLTPLPKRQNT